MNLMSDRIMNKQDAFAEPLRKLAQLEKIISDRSKEYVRNQEIYNREKEEYHNKIMSLDEDEFKNIRKLGQSVGHKYINLTTPIETVKEHLEAFDTDINIQHETNAHYQLLIRIAQNEAKKEFIEKEINNMICKIQDCLKVIRNDIENMKKTDFNDKDLLLRENDLMKELVDLENILSGATTVKIKK